MSYDPVETLERFSRVHAITYPLLSDEGSAVITEIGVLNTTIEQERAAYGRPMEDRHRGIPYPGTFFLDEDGVVIDKRFEQSHRIRPTGTTLLKQLLGEDEVPPAVSAEAASPGVRVAAWLDTDVVFANQLQEVHVRFAMDPEVHLYVDPVPEGFTAVSVELAGDDRLRPEPVAIAGGHPFEVDGLDESFLVVEGAVETSIPFVLLSNRDTAGDPDRPVELEVNVSFQACTSAACYLPEHISLRLPLIERPNPGYETSEAAAISPLAFRRIVEQPRRDDELFKLVNDALEGTSVSADQLAQVLEELADGGFIARTPQDTWAIPG
jgi:hypothetical protein